MSIQILCPFKFCRLPFYCCKGFLRIIRFILVFMVTMVYTGYKSLIRYTITNIFARSMCCLFHLLYNVDVLLNFNGNVSSVYFIFMNIIHMVGFSEMFGFIEEISCFQLTKNFVKSECCLLLASLLALSRRSILLTFLLFMCCYH